MDDLVLIGAALLLVAFFIGLIVALDPLTTPERTGDTICLDDPNNGGHSLGATVCTDMSR